LQDVYAMLYSQDAGVARPEFDALQMGMGMEMGGVVAGGGSGSGADAMVELGLTSESGMDAAWLAFIQQCGVSLGGSPVHMDESDISLFD
jgi:hypothetical protein